MYRYRSNSTVAGSECITETQFHRRKFFNLLDMRTNFRPIERPSKKDFLKDELIVGFLLYQISKVH